MRFEFICVESRRKLHKFLYYVILNHAEILCTGNLGGKNLYLHELNYDWYNLKKKVLKEYDDSF